MLAACASSNPQSMTQSLAQTHQLVPTISCAEDAPDEVLPNYPHLTDDGALDAMPLDVQVQFLKSDRTAQVVWAVQAAGQLGLEKKKRAATKQCLSQLRARGLIN
jgi:hypothetical protein